jgi:ABC-type sugar transport system ATPase subunit
MRRVARDMAESVSVDARRLKSDAADLSGGNQQKLAFARLIEQGSPGVLLLNEPTRGVDVGARADIYKLIRRFCDEGWCVILASSDMEEVLGLGDKIIALYRGQVASVYPRSETNEDRVLSDITHARNAA